MYIAALASMWKVLAPHECRSASLVAPMLRKSAPVCAATLESASTSSRVKPPTSTLTLFCATSRRAARAAASGPGALARVSTIEAPMSSPFLLASSSPIVRPMRAASPTARRLRRDVGMTEPAIGSTAPIRRGSASRARAREARDSAAAAEPVARRWRRPMRSPAHISRRPGGSALAAASRSGARRPPPAPPASCPRCGRAPGRGCPADPRPPGARQWSARRSSG